MDATLITLKQLGENIVVRNPFIYVWQIWNVSLELKVEPATCRDPTTIPEPFLINDWILAERIIRVHLCLRGSWRASHH